MTTAIAYTSGKPHIGNTYEIVLADAIARYKRQEGYDQQCDNESYQFFYKEFHNSLLRLPLLILLLFPGYCSRAGTFGTESAVRKRGSNRNLLDCNCIFYCST